METLTEHRYTVVEHPATQPGALDGWAMHCTCGDVQTSSLSEAAARDLGAAHVRYWIDRAMTITIPKSFGERYHDEIRDLVRYGFGPDAGLDVEVHVKRSSRSVASGMAYPSVGGVIRVTDGVRYLVTIRLPAWRDEPDGGVVEFKHRDLSERWRHTLRGWREQLVGVAAHEAQHVRQYRTGAPRSEADAEDRAISAVRAFREGRPAPERGWDQ